MPRKFVLLSLMALVVVCMLLFWQFVVLKTSVKSMRSEDSQSISIVRNSIQFVGNATQALQNAIHPLPKTARPTIPRAIAKTTQPAKPAPLPELTLAAQDSFYGAGCKDNRYRKRLQKVLQEWGRLAKRRNITRFFICFGSFLGSVRNGDIVPYDSDMDVCMFRSEYYKLEPEKAKRPVNLDDGRFHLLLQRHSPHPKPDTPRLNCEGIIVRHQTDHCSILDPHARLYIGTLIYLDIFMIEDHGPKLWDEYRDKIHDRDAMLPVKPCKFLGLDTQCPNNAEKYLNVYYGKDYMKPHHVCKGGKWVQNMAGAREAFV